MFFTLKYLTNNNLSVFTVYCISQLLKGVTRDFPFFIRKAFDHMMVMKVANFFLQIIMRTQLWELTFNSSRTYIHIFFNYINFRLWISTRWRRTVSYITFTHALLQKRTKFSFRIHKSADSMMKYIDVMQRNVQIVQFSFFSLLFYSDG